MLASSADSSTGGYLAPTGPAPVSDLALDILIQGFVAGVTGLPGDLVRPRWQDGSLEDGAATPRVPNQGITWCAVGVMLTSSDDTPALIHDGAGDGSTLLRRFDSLEVLASFYGPNGDAYARLTRDAFYVGQNREAMYAKGLTFISSDPIRRLPEITATNTRRRSDLAFRLVQRVERTYPIRNVQQGVGTITADGSSNDGPVVTTTPIVAPEI